MCIVNIDSKMSRNNGSKKSTANINRAFARDRIKKISKNISFLFAKKITLNCVKKLAKILSRYKNYIAKKYNPRFGGVKQIFPKDNVVNLFFDVF